jgi:hypothetical protein
MVNARLSFRAREMLADPVALRRSGDDGFDSRFLKEAALARADGGRLPIIPSCATEGVTTRAKASSFESLPGCRTETGAGAALKLL